MNQKNTQEINDNIAQYTNNNSAAFFDGDLDLLMEFCKTEKENPNVFVIIQVGATKCGACTRTFHHVKNNFLSEIKVLFDQNHIKNTKIVFLNLKLDVGVKYSKFSETIAENILKKIVPESKRETIRTLPTFLVIQIKKFAIIENKLEMEVFNPFHEKNIEGSNNILDAEKFKTLILNICNIK